MLRFSSDRRRGRALILGFLALVLPVIVEAQERPKIGIAFSGGGAKGCAHIGVLRVLEEMRIPVDYSAGASMGSIVGGLYATGMTLEELEQIILTVDWADALTDKPGRSELSFRRKDDDLRYLPDIEAGIGKGGLRMPTGLRSGQKLNFLLRRFTLPVRTLTDFDALPVPFRAVATDIGTGESVVLDHGDLAVAMRASMAIPTVFSAVPMDGRLLVDGGVTNNVPVNVVRDMGADVVIAIDIGSPLTGATEVGRSYLKILGQTLGLITRANMTPQLAAADMVITPPVSGYGTLEFSKGREIIAAGEAEARKYVEQLRPYALSEEDYRTWKASRHRAPDPLPVVTAVRIEGNQRVDSRVLAHLVQLTPGAVFSPDAANRDMTRLFGLGDFESIDIDLEPEGGGTTLIYRVHEKPWGPTYLRLGLALEADLEGENSLSLLAGVNRTRINALGAEWKTDIQLGSETVAQTGFYQPLSFRQGWFVEPSVRYRRRTLSLFVDRNRVAELDVPNTAARLDLGYLFGRYGEVRLGIERGWITPRRESGEVPAELESYLNRTIERGGLTFSGTYDRLDNAKLPKRGGRVYLAAFHGLDSLGAEDEYTKVELRSAGYKTRGRLTLFGQLSGGVSPGGFLPPYDRFLLGGFLSLSGFEPGELHGDNYAVLRAGGYYRLTKLFYGGAYFEAARVGDEPNQLVENPVLTATAMLVADTAAGPLYFAVAGAEQGKRKFYLLYGRLF